MPSVDLSRLDSTLRTKYWSWTFLDPAQAPTMLLDVLQDGLPHISSNSWPERFDFGGVYVNGLLAIADQRLPFPCKVEYYEPKFEISRAREIYPAFPAHFIVFHDQDVVVAFKPTRLPTMPAKEQRHFSMKAELERHLNVKVHMPSRLDVSVSGLVVASTSARSHPILQQMFETRQVTKVYRLETASPPKWQTNVVEASIGRDPLHPVLRRVVESGGQAAKTNFSVLRRDKDSNSAILGAEPVTGRTHQIRVHAAHIGCPIVGDNFYGGAPEESLHLVSFSISLRHPQSGKELRFELPASLYPSWL